MSEAVQNAPRRERVKRTAWQLGALAISVLVITAALSVLAQLGVDRENTLGAIAILTVHFHIFGWGVDRFDITPPREFREESSDG